MIRCPVCGRELPETEFSGRFGKSNGRQTYCKSCMREYCSKRRMIVKPKKASRSKLERLVKSAKRDFAEINMPGEGIIDYEMPPICFN